MPLLDAHGNPIQQEKPAASEKSRTTMQNIPAAHADKYAEEIGKNAHNVMGMFAQQFNPISAICIAAQLTAILFNSINFPTIDEKTNTEKMLRDILENGLKNGDDAENPTPALLGNVLLSPQPH